MEAFLLRHPGNTRKPFKLECFRKLLHCVRNCRSWISCEQISCPETCKLHQESGWNETGWLWDFWAESIKPNKREWECEWFIFWISELPFHFSSNLLWHRTQGEAMLDIVLSCCWSSSKTKKNPKQKSTKFNIDPQGTPVKCKWTVV